MLRCIIPEKLQKKFCLKECDMAKGEFSEKNYKLRFFLKDLEYPLENSNGFL